MAKIPFSDALRKQYEYLFNTCAIDPKRTEAVERTVNALMGERARYQDVGAKTGAPWFFIGAIHAMESGFSFNKHMHNGDPLVSRTVQVPKGRPKRGNPPFSWEESAVDALAMRGIRPGMDWSLAACLYQLEGYNGWGYRLYHPHVLSPYLWSFSNHYLHGKYVADGTWSDTAASKQCGAAVLLRRMAECHHLEFPDQPTPRPEAPPLVVGYSTTIPNDAGILTQAQSLQQWLNTFPGVFVKADGIPGPRTSDSFRAVTDRFLPGDPRA